MNLSIGLSHQLCAAHAFSFCTAKKNAVSGSISNGLRRSFVIRGRGVCSDARGLGVGPFRFSLRTTLKVRCGVGPALNTFVRPKAIFCFGSNDFGGAVHSGRPLRFGLRLKIH